MADIEMALHALKDGALIKRYDGGFNAYFGEELLLSYGAGEYQLGVVGKSGTVPVSDYGKAWVVRPKDIYEITGDRSDEEADELLKELFEENFAA